MEVIVVGCAVQPMAHTFDNIGVLRIDVLQIDVRPELPDQPLCNLEAIGAGPAFDGEPFRADAAHQAVQCIGALFDRERHIAFFHDHEKGAGVEVAVCPLDCLQRIERLVGKLFSQLGEHRQPGGERMLDGVHPVTGLEIDRIFADFHAAESQLRGAFHELRDAALYRGHLERYAAGQSFDTHVGVKSVLAAYRFRRIAPHDAHVVRNLDVVDDIADGFDHVSGLRKRLRLVAHYRKPRMRGLAAWAGRTRKS
jgi:hypothetical protein